ncbi:hypothetical protein [Arenibacter echinorum]|uniref:Tellurite resistance protein TerB n=1 Tax=Arenibacter echinorum TaxID=440515 RepID=A0A327REC7_9FLAO|nr:hypothetical protein [Arenibacter echinorum]RAJ15356.1 hypothetical protein LV92_00049 [Arenibacter echinorum]
MNTTDYRKELSDQEHDLLLKFPAYISLLAANADGALDKDELLVANELAGIKNFSCHLLLEDFYKEVTLNFETTLVDLDKSLPIGKDGRFAAITAELADIEKIMLKLGDEYTSIMHKSMRSFKDHVSHAHHNVLVDLIFPIPIKGLSY